MARSVYIPPDMVKEIEAEAQRQDRTFSQMIQQAWKIARNRLHSAPSTVEILEQAAERRR